MREQRYFKAALVTYALALCISVYLVYDHYQLINGENFKSICSVSPYFDCDAVNSSRYAVIFGVPLATWGLCYYLFGAILSALAIGSAFTLREVSFLLLPSSFFSVAASAVLLTVSVTQVNAICLFCASLYVLNLFSAFFVAWGGTSQLRSPRREWKKVQKPRLLFFVGTGVVTSLLLIIATQQLKGTATFDPKDFEERWAKTVTPGLEANHSPRLGTAHSSAKIKLVEFSDFQCPFCARQARELTRILRNYGDAVELVFKNFPLDMSCNPLMKFPMHDSACLAARAAWCSHQHQVFEEFGALMFANQRNLGFEQIVAWAGELKLNRNAFEKCLSSPEARAAVSADIKAAQIANIQGTPTFFINGRRFEGLVTMELIEWLLKNPQKL